MKWISQTVCIVALVGCGQRPAQPEVAKGTETPETGSLKFPQSANPGDPENAIKDFRRFYWALDEYRKKYKKLPTTMEFRDTSKELLPGVKLEPEDFENADNLYAEFDPVGGKPPQPYTFAFYTFPKPKPGSPALKDPPIDGWDRPVFPPKGVRYKWAMTHIYTRTNARVFPSGGTTYHHTGFHIVLWSDGSIEKIPKGKILLQPMSKTEFRNFFPGEPNIGKDAFPTTKHWEEFNAMAIANGKEPFITWENREIEVVPK